MTFYSQKNTKKHGTDSDSKSYVHISAMKQDTTKTVET